MAGIKGNTVTVLMGDGDTAADNTFDGFLTSEQVTLSATPTGDSYVWGIAKPAGSSGRCALSATTGATPVFIPDVAGYYTITCTVDDTAYTLRLSVTQAAISTYGEASRYPPRAATAVTAPPSGRALFCNASNSDRLAAKLPDASVIDLEGVSVGSCADGTISAPSITFSDETDLGWYRAGTGQLCAVDGSELCHVIGDQTVSNLEPAPNEVRHGLRLYQRPQSTSALTAAVYCRLDFGQGAHPIFAYCEIDDDQADGYGGAWVGVHKGAGDHFYVAIPSNAALGGVSFESATWRDGSKGIISTIQAESLPYSTLFNTVWGQEAPNTVPLYGAVYLDESTGNALTIRKSATCNTGYPQMRLWENDISRTRWSLYGEGTTINESLAASAGITIRDSPDVKLRGAYWTGAANQDRDVVLRHVVTATTPASELRVYIGNTGAETQVATLTDTVGSGEAGIYILYDGNGGVKLGRVEVDAADSGGAGYRRLRVAN